MRQRADVKEIDNQQIARLGTLDPDRTGEEVDDRKVDVAHVIGGVVVLDEATGPIVGLDDEIVARLDPEIIGTSGCQRLWIAGFL